MLFFIILLNGATVYCVYVLCFLFYRLMNPFLFLNTGPEIEKKMTQFGIDLGPILQNLSDQ